MECVGAGGKRAIKREKEDRGQGEFKFGRKTPVYFKDKITRSCLITF